MLNLFVVFFGGGLGASLRYFINNAAEKYFGNTIFGTFSANILGCFLIGYIFGFMLNKTEIIPPALKLFLTVGFLGGLTTFSSFSNESLCLLKDGKITNCILYMSASIILGLSASYIGYSLNK